MTGARIEGNVIGSTAANFVDPGAGVRSAMINVNVDRGDDGWIVNNLIGFSEGAGIQLATAASSWEIVGNEIRRSGLTYTNDEAIDITRGVAAQGPADNLISGNLLTDNNSSGLHLWQDASGHTVVNNTVSNNASGSTGDVFGIGLDNPDAGNVIDRNVITGNAGPGVRVGTTIAGSNINSGYVRITQNAISGNTGLGIDLDNTVPAPRDGDGVTANDGAGDVDAGPNNLQNFPTATAFTTDGTDLTVTGLTIPGPGANSYRIEFFASAAADPSGNGEGTRYLGSRDVLGGATFNGTLAGFNVAPGEYVSMTATRTDALVPTLFFETSEFSAAYLAAAVFDVSGTIYEDVEGDSVDGAAPADWVGRDNVRVRLFRDGGDGIANGTDTFVTSTLTGAGGTYTFANQAAGTYWVVVDSRTITPSTGTSIANQVWAEQTYGTAGAWGGGLTPTGVLATSGALYGGRSATNSDNSTDAPGSLSNSDHVTRVAVAASDVTGVDSAFSFNVVTNVRGDGADDEGNGANPRLQQGSLHQFILNANATGGANAMVFVPAVNANVDGGDGLGNGNDYWRINVTTALPQITGVNAVSTTIDGTAFGFTYGAAGIAVRDDNAGALGTGGTVGVGGVALSTVDRPELEIADGAAVGVIDFGLDLRAANASVLDLSIWGFGDGAVWAASGNIGVQGDANDNVVIERNVIGTGASAFALPATPGEGAGIYINQADSGRIQNNLIGFVGFAGVDINSSANDWRIQGNEIRSVAQVDPNVWFDGINVVGGNTGLIVRENLITASASPGIDLAQNAQVITIENNTISGNATGAGQEQFGIRITNPSGSVLVDRNVISGNTGPGILVMDPVPVAGVVTITRNSIYGNVADTVGPVTSSGIGIDLAVGGANGDGVTVPDAGDIDAGPNNLQNQPTLSSATLGAGTVTVDGSLLVPAGLPSVRIEFFSSPAADPSGSGEGQTYLGTLDITDNGVGDTNLAAGTIGFSHTMAAVVTPGHVITATATRSVAGFGSFFETSEFSNAVGTATISGRLWEDVNGNGAILDDGVGVNNVDVRLYRDNLSAGVVGAPDAADILVGSAITSGGGLYAFSSLATGTYWVIADSTDVLPAAGTAAPTSVWAEQTYGSDGAATYSAGAYTYRSGAGTHFGGLITDRSDDFTVVNPTAIPRGAEHITRVQIAGASATNVDSGFSFSAVTNARGDNTDDDGAGTGRLQQGSLRQFVLNSNVINGVQTSDFSIAGGGAQTITLAQRCRTLPPRSSSTRRRRKASPPHRSFSSRAAAPS